MLTILLSILGFHFNLPTMVVFGYIVLEKKILNIIDVFLLLSSRRWLEYCRYGVKTKTIKQSIKLLPSLVKDVTLGFISMNVNPLYIRMLCTKFGSSWPWGRRFSNFAIISPWKQVWPFTWYKLEFLSPKNALCQVQLKFVECFWRR